VYGNHYAAVVVACNCFHTYEYVLEDPMRVLVLAVRSWRCSVGSPSPTPRHHDPELVSRLKVVTWNLEYTSSLDARIAALTTHPQLADADVYLFSEADRCAHNGKRRAIREIGRVIGGDPGQAIVSRRPLVDAQLTCHSSQHDARCSCGRCRRRPRARSVGSRSGVAVLDVE